jgi:hypothetical protein
MVRRVELGAVRDGPLEALDLVCQVVPLGAGAGGWQGCLKGGVGDRRERGSCAARGRRGRRRWRGPAAPHRAARSRRSSTCVLMFWASHSSSISSSGTTCFLGGGCVGAGGMNAGTRRGPRAGKGVAGSGRLEGARRLAPALAAPHQHRAPAEALLGAQDVAIAGGGGAGGGGDEGVQRSSRGRVRERGAPPEKGGRSRAARARRERPCARCRRAPSSHVVSDVQHLGAEGAGRGLGE